MCVCLGGGDFQPEAFWVPSPAWKSPAVHGPAKPFSVSEQSGRDRILHSQWTPWLPEGLFYLLKVLVVFWKEKLAPHPSTCPGMLFCSLLGSIPQASSVALHLCRPRRRSSRTG